MLKQHTPKLGILTAIRGRLDIRSAEKDMCRIFFKDLKAAAHLLEYAKEMRVNASKGKVENGKYAVAVHYLIQKEQELDFHFMGGESPKYGFSYNMKELLLELTEQKEKKVFFRLLSSIPRVMPEMISLPHNVLDKYMYFVLDYQGFYELNKGFVDAIKSTPADELPHPKQIEPKALQPGKELAYRRSRVERFAERDMRNIFLNDVKAAKIRLEAAKQALEELERAKPADANLLEKCAKAIYDVMDADRKLIFHYGDSGKPLEQGSSEYSYRMENVLFEMMVRVDKRLGFLPEKMRPYLRQISQSHTTFREYAKFSDALLEFLQQRESLLEVMADGIKLRGEEFRFGKGPTAP